MKLDDDSFQLYAAKHYDIKKAANVEEFYDDMKRFQYLKKLFKRYSDSGELKTRLILNHTIVLYNCFGTFTTAMLFMKLEGYHHMLKPFIEYLNYLPEYVHYRDTIIPTKDIYSDSAIMMELSKI